ncbi:MAG: cytochrome c3 family protein [Planctomycetota bacterium]
MIRRARFRFFLLAVTAVAVAMPLVAPGQTSIDSLDITLEWPRVHEVLAGQEHCARCHDATQRPSNDRCLECHEEIRVGPETVAGDHDNVVRRDGQDCTTCHREHRGASEERTLWNDENGMKRFDHEPTDYPLSGRHAEVQCRTCHRPENVVERVTQRSRPEESLLGLSSACASCHADVH